MAETDPIDGAVAAAATLLEDRLQAVRDLATSREHVDAKRAELDEAERAHATAYAAAERAGWTADELRKLGYPVPAKKAPGRPRKTPAATTANKATRTATGPVADGDVATGQVVSAATGNGQKADGQPTA